MKTITGLAENLCLHCHCPVETKDEKWWRWSGWVAYGAAPSAPAPPIVDKKVKRRDIWDWLFHKECFPEWIYNRDLGMQDLDRPVNNCIYFERTGTSIHGYYVREGKKHPCLSCWTEYDVFGTAIFPTLVSSFQIDMPSVVVTLADGGQAFREAFRAFLHKNNWLNEGWYQPRREVVYRNAVELKMKDKYGDNRTS